MNLYTRCFLLLFLATPAYAQEAPPQPGFGEMLFSMLPMFALVYLIFFFMVTRPQQMKLKKQAELVASLKKGETVATTGGIIGRVAASEKDYILLDVSNNVKIKVENAHVARRWEQKAGEKKE